MKPFEIFRTGTWTSDKGITKEYTESDLDKLVENYNSEDPAPIVIGHPQTNSPAYGWIEKIKRVADRLIAVPKQLNEDFVKLVKEGAFKKRSVSFTPEFKLNHVGFLGAAAPAVAGLKEIQFNLEEDLLSFSDEYLPDDDEEVIQEKLEKISTPEKELKIKLDTKQENPKDAGHKNFQDSIDSLNQIVSDLKQNFSQLNDDELKKIHSRINELQFSIQMNDFELRLNEKLAYGSLTPAMKNKIVDLVSFMQKQNFSGAEFSFDKYISDVKNLLIQFVESIPKIIYYDNFAEKPSSAAVNVEEFEEYNLDEDSLEVHKKALQYMLANDGVSYVEAINKISNS